MSAFPVEIWRKVLLYLPNVDIRSVNLASWKLYTIATPLLFSFMRIRFGQFPIYSEAGDVLDIDTYQHEEEVEMTRSMNILLRIHERNSNTHTRELALSELIQSFRIEVAGIRHMMVFERYHIRAALGCLRHLRHFAWRGDRLPLDVAEVLAEAHSDIESLHLHGLGYDCALVLHTLNSLCDLQLIDANASSATQYDVSPGNPDSALSNILESNHKSLRCLSLSGKSAWLNSASLLRVADTLTHLSLNDTRTCPGLDLFLRHACALQALTLLDLTSLACLPSEEISLRQLRDFKLGVDMLPAKNGLRGHAEIALPDLRELASTLFLFLVLHKNLRRFDFSLWSTCDYYDIGGAPHGDNIEWYIDVVRAVCVLEDIQVLGLSLPALNEQDQSDVLMYLTKNAPTLRMCTAVRLSGVIDASMDYILGGLQNCTFLSLSNARPSEFCVPTQPVPSVSELVFHHGLKALSQVCLGGRLFDLPSALDGQFESEIGFRAVPWSETRVRERIESDFCTYDAYWLMSYRTILKIYEHADLDADYGVGDAGMEWD